MKQSVYLRFILLSIIYLLIETPPASAHFGTIIPSDSMVNQGENTRVHLTLSFMHPFEQAGMNLARPKSFGVVAHGKNISILKQIKQTSVLGHLAWQSDYRIRRPGVYTFYMEPEPYWEKAEDCFIIHYTKTVISAFGDDDSWDTEIGLKTEIVPITRPFALYTHNLFQGIVKFNGKPVPFATVEVEFYNAQKKAQTRNELFITQTLKADGNGLFSYAVPKSGWWGFAALNPADYQLTFQGVKKDVELGAVIWVQFHDWL
ncbi:MAG: DUF4198 domain-containing protein [bacterium]